MWVGKKQAWSFATAGLWEHNPSPGEETGAASADLEPFYHWDWMIEMLPQARPIGQGYLSQLQPGRLVGGKGQRGLCCPDPGLVPECPPSCTPWLIPLNRWDIRPAHLYSAQLDLMLWICYRINPFGGQDTVTKISLFPWGLSVLGSSCPLPGRNCGSQCQSLVKRKGTIYSKVIQV